MSDALNTCRVLCGNVNELRNRASEITCKDPVTGLHWDHLMLQIHQEVEHLYDLNRCIEKHDANKDSIARMLELEEHIYNNKKELMKQIIRQTKMPTMSKSIIALLIIINKRMDEYGNMEKEVIGEYISVIKDRYKEFKEDRKSIEAKLGESNYSLMVDHCCRKILYYFLNPDEDELERYLERFVDYYYKAPDKTEKKTQEVAYENPLYVELKRHENENVKVRRQKNAADGRPDICIKSNIPKKVAIVELKSVEKEGEIEVAHKKALEQINKKKYVKVSIDWNCTASDTYCYTVVYWKNTVSVRRPVVDVSLFPENDKTLKFHEYNIQK